MVKPPASGLSATEIWNVATTPLLALVNLVLALQASVSALAQSSVRNLTPIRKLLCLQGLFEGAGRGGADHLVAPHADGVVLRHGPVVVDLDGPPPVLDLEARRAAHVERDQ